MVQPRTLVLVVDEQTRHVRDDDRVLVRALEAAGARVVPVVWGEPLPADADLVVLRSPWDYIDRLDEFLAWLDDLAGRGLAVCNEPALVRWNAHKGYLRELEGTGVPVVPTAHLARGAEVDLAGLLAERGWSDAVAKPAVGAGSKGAVHVARAGLEVAQAHLDELARAHDVLVQPFLPEIERGGELSIVAAAGEVTHVVRKQPQPGEWRIQSDYGGTAALVAPDDHHRATARRVLAAVPAPDAPPYARVDVVEVDGELLLMEVELIEPELWLSLVPEAADALAEAILR
ncbi:MAG: hypothetical protein U0P45_03865 [Acidimicrobiales bacterium]